MSKEIRKEVSDFTADLLERYPSNLVLSEMFKANAFIAIEFAKMKNKSNIEATDALNFPDGTQYFVSFNATEIANKH